MATEGTFKVWCVRDSQKLLPVSVCHPIGESLEHPCWTMEKPLLRCSATCLRSSSNSEVRVIVLAVSWIRVLAPRKALFSGALQLS